MMEFMHQGYEDVMAMPIRRRHRLVLRKLEVEKKKQRQMEARSGKMGR